MFIKNIILGISLLFMIQTVQAGQWSIGLLAGQSSTEGFDSDCNQIRGVDFINPIEGAPPIIGNGFFVSINCNADDTATALGLNLAYNFNQRWGLELGYMDLGDYDFDISISSSSPFVIIDSGSGFRISNELSALYLVGTVNFQLTNAFSLTGRLGAANIELDISASDLSISEDETETMAGISLNYDFSDKIRAELRYDYFDFNSSIDVASIGLRYNF